MNPDNEVQQAPAEVVEFSKLPEWKQKDKAKKDAKKKEREEKLIATYHKKQAELIGKRKARIDALVEKGMQPQQAEATLQREEFFSLDIPKQIKVLVNNTQAIISQVLQDIGALKHNDEILSEAMDLNFRAMAKCLEKAGIKPEDQQAIITEVQKDMETELKAKIEAEATALKAQAEAQKATVEATEQSKIEQDAKEASESRIITDAAPEGPAEFPEAAQVYGNET